MYESFPMIPHICAGESWEQAMYQLESPPPPQEKWQDYIDLRRFHEDSNAFLVFLHYYEPTINSKVNAFMEHYGLQGHFADLKMAYVDALWQRLGEYDEDCKIPFLKYAKRAVTDAMHSYAAKNLKGFSGPDDKQHYRLRTAAYIYKTECYGNMEQAITTICDRLHVQPKTAQRLIEEVVMLDTFLWYDEKWEQEDYEGPPDGSDMIGLLKPHMPEPALLRKEFRKHLRESFWSLSYLEQCIVSKHLGFYKECFRPLFSVSFEDLADQYQYATADGVRKAYNRALEKLRKELEVKGLLESVRLKQLRGSKKLLRYEYRPMDAGEPGMIEFSLQEGIPVSHGIITKAEYDTEELSFGRSAAFLIYRQAARRDLPKNQVFIIPDGDPMPSSHVHNTPSPTKK